MERAADSKTMVSNSLPQEGAWALPFSYHVRVDVVSSRGLLELGPVSLFLK
jgi:hypothetical protein